MSRYDMETAEFARMLHHIADEVQYALEVQSYDDCNTCGKKNCEYMPKPGELVRINCPLWAVEEQENECAD